MFRAWMFLLLPGLCLSATPVTQASDIAGSELRILTGPIDPAPHHHSKHLIIRPESLSSGWVADRQCHENLDPVPALQVVFGPGKVRKLRVTRSEGIDVAQVEGNSVQLQQVGAGAVLCLESENHALIYDSLLNLYTLVSGPYMRRFLDGYFPMRVSLNVEYPAQLLRLVDIQPVESRAGAGTPPGRVQIDTMFEGELRIKLRFAPVPTQ